MFNKILVLLDRQRYMLVMLKAVLFHPTLGPEIVLHLERDRVGRLYAEFGLDGIIFNQTLQIDNAWCWQTCVVFMLRLRGF